ncbi:DUF721 domain-containing protein [bacterium]|nr:DUF721 domain-containing protein [bacterium]
MSLRPGNSDIRSILIDILRKMPESAGHRRALVRLLWVDAAGPIISRHVVIRKCNINGRVAVEVNDVRWMHPIRQASRLIIERMNTALLKLGLPEYMIDSLDIYPVQAEPPASKEIVDQNREVEIPPEITRRINALPDSMQDGLKAWYLAVKQHQDSCENSEN